MISKVGFMLEAQKLIFLMITMYGFKLNNPNASKPAVVEQVFSLNKMSKSTKQQIEDITSSISIWLYYKD